MMNWFKHLYQLINEDVSQRKKKNKAIQNIEHTEHSVFWITVGHEDDN